MSLRARPFPDCCGAQILSGFGFCMGQAERPSPKAQERWLADIAAQHWTPPVKVIILTTTQARHWKARLEAHRFERVTNWMRGSHTTRFAIFVRHNNPRVDPRRSDE